MDYTELVKRLREQVECDKKLYPQGPPFETLLLDLAADVIEYLISALNHADEQIVKLVEANEKRRWIAVEERLPEDGVPVLICGDPNAFEIATYWSDWKSWFDCNGFWTFAHHWMPLPEPPKEETE